MCDDRAVVKRYTVAERDEIGFRHEARSTTGPDRAVLADASTECAVEPHDVR